MSLILTSSPTVPSVSSVRRNPHAARHPTRKSTQAALAQPGESIRLPSPSPSSHPSSAVRGAPGLLALAPRKHRQSSVPLFTSVPDLGLPLLWKRHFNPFVHSRGAGNSSKTTQLNIEFYTLAGLLGWFQGAAVLLFGLEFLHHGLKVHLIPAFHNLVILDD